MREIHILPDGVIHLLDEQDQDTEHEAMISAPAELTPTPTTSDSK